MTEHEKVEFICKIAELSPENQNRFFQEISGIVTDKELEALQIAASYFGMLLNPEKGRAMKEAMAAQMYAELRA